MRQIISLVSLILLVATAGCGHASPLEPPWPPNPPIYREPPQVDQGTVNHIVFLMIQIEVFDWYSSWDRDVLWSGLEAIYAQAIADGDDIWAQIVLSHMGDTGMTEFMPTLISALDRYPRTVCSSLGNMPSDYAIYALIPYLNDEDVFVRKNAALALGQSPAYSLFPFTRLFALQALEQRRLIESVDWIREDITDAIKKILAEIKI